MNTNNGVSPTNSDALCNRIYQHIDSVSALEKYLPSFNIPKWRTTNSKTHILCDCPECKASDGIRIYMNRENRIAWQCTRCGINRKKYNTIVGLYWLFNPESRNINARFATIVELINPRQENKDEWLGPSGPHGEYSLDNTVDQISTDYLIHLILKQSLPPDYENYVLDYLLPAYIKVDDSSIETSPFMAFEDAYDNDKPADYLCKLLKRCADAQSLRTDDVECKIRIAELANTIDDARNDIYKLGTIYSQIVREI